MFRALMVAAVLVSFTSFAHAQSCNDDDDCGTDLWCVGGMCISRCSFPVKPHAGLPCGQDTDCVNGEYCKDGLCEVETASTCMTNADCPGDQLCIGGICRDLLHAAANVKKLITIKPACIDNTDCQPGDSCIDNQCVFGGGCLGDVDCPIGSVCRQGLCVGADRSIKVKTVAHFGESCQSDAECANDEVCINNICQLKDQAQCQSSADCIFGEICVGGFCMDRSSFLQSVVRRARAHRH